MITIIVPTIARPSLVHSIQSLLNQTNPNWQAMVVFDGVEPISIPTDDRITVLRSHKLGMIKTPHCCAGHVRNYALDHVATEWVGFLDDDDCLTPDYVEKFYKYSQEDVDLILFKLVFPDGRVMPSGSDFVLYDCGISFCLKTKHNLRFVNSHIEDYLFLDNVKKLGIKYKVVDEVVYLVNWRQGLSSPN